VTLPDPGQAGSPSLDSTTWVCDKYRLAFYSLLDSPLRTVLEIVPEKWITFDSGKSARDMAGALPEEEKTERKSSDAVRMNKEREIRGLDPR
jgi:hypothetical protein